MEHAPTWLTYGFLYLTAAVLAVPIAKALGLGAIIGYLAAGIAIGPWGLGLVSNVQDILHFAEFGVVLMLFLVGWSCNPAACGPCAAPSLAPAPPRCWVARRCCSRWVRWPACPGV